MSVRIGKAIVNTVTASFNTTVLPYYRYFVVPICKAQSTQIVVLCFTSSVFMITKVVLRNSSVSHGNTGSSSHASSRALGTEPKQFWMIVGGTGTKNV